MSKYVIQVVMGRKSVQLAHKKGFDTVQKVSQTIAGEAKQIRYEERTFSSKTQLGAFLEGFYLAQTWKNSEIEINLKD